MSKVGVTGILRETAKLLSRYPAPALVALTVLVIPSVWVDMRAGANAVQFNWLISVVSIFAQYLTIAHLLRHEGLLSAADKAGRAASFIGVGIVTGIAIGLGTLLLIVPGLYLFARWAIVDPLIIGEGRTMGEAMSESWQETAHVILPTMIALAVFYSPLAVSLLAAFAYPEFDTAALPMALASNLLIFIGIILSWYCAAAVFRLLRQPQDTLDQIFA
jgi:hypothetical protein